MDSNVVIDYMGDKLPITGSQFIDSLPVIISVITRIEIVGWYGATQRQISSLVQFTDKAFVFQLSEDIIQ